MKREWEVLDQIQILVSFGLTKRPQPKKATGYKGHMYQLSKYCDPLGWNLGSWAMVAFYTCGLLLCDHRHGTDLHNLEGH